MAYEKLKGLMVSKGITQNSLAKELHISEGKLSHKFTGQYQFKQSEIKNICRCLNIKPNEIGAYFFYS